MALSNTLNVNLGGGVGDSVVLTLTDGTNNYGTLTYQNSTTQITFSAMSSYDISGYEQLAIIAQYAVFNNAIIANFFPPALPSQWTIINYKEQYVSYANIWTYQFEKQSSNVLLLSASGSTGNVAGTSEGSVTLNYPEFLMLLSTIQHYGASITSFLNL